jgi:hypothetical protein
VSNRFRREEWTVALTELDHLVCVASDIEASAAKLMRLGFAVTPPSAHDAHLGTANCCVMLDRSYLELLSPIDLSASSSRQVRALLDAAGECVAAIAYKTPSARALHDELSARGADQARYDEFSRPVALPDGQRGVAEFAICMLPDVPGFACRVFGCEHRTPQHLWRHEWLAHPNSAVRLASVHSVSDRPTDLAGALVRTLETSKGERIDTGAYRIGGDTPLIVSDRGYLQRRFGAPLAESLPGSSVVAAVIEVASLVTARSVLDRGGIPALHDEHRTIIAASDAVGCALVFEEAL